MIIQTSPLIYLGIHALLEGPGWSGIGIIQYIWAYCPVHTFEVKGGGGGAVFLKVSQAEYVIPTDTAPPAPLPKSPMCYGFNWCYGVCPCKGVSLC